MESERRVYRRHGPSIFFPILLITVGLIWLLVNAGMIPVENVQAILPYWPVLLVLAGISLLLSQVSWLFSAVIWLALAAFLIWLLMTPNNLIASLPRPELKRETVSETIGETERAVITLDTGRFPTQISSLQGSDNLIEADISFSGDLNFRVSGTTEKEISLSETFSGVFLGNEFLGGDSRTWRIGLTPEIPLSILLDSGSGSIGLNLDGLQVESLSIDSGSGSVEVGLPVGNTVMAFDLEMGSGSVEITIPSGSSTNLTIDGGSGSVVIDVPDDAGIQVTMEDDGSGSFRLPDGYSLVREGGDQGEGTWENEAFATDENPTRISIDQGSGNIEIR